MNVGAPALEVFQLASRNGDDVRTAPCSGDANRLGVQGYRLGQDIGKDCDDATVTIEDRGAGSSAIESKAIIAIGDFEKSRARETILGLRACRLKACVPDASISHEMNRASAHPTRFRELPR